MVFFAKGHTEGLQIMASEHKKLDSKRQMSYAEPMPQQILTWRLRLKLTQKQLAQELGVTERTIQRYERGLPARPGTLFLIRLKEWLAEVRAAERMVQDRVRGEGYQP